MIRTVCLVALILMLPSPAHAQQPGARRIADFEVLVEQKRGGWSAVCVSGCLWKTVAITCRAACRPVLDEDGLAATGVGRRESTSFAFTLERSESGVAATTLHGTTWLKASAGCRVLSCKTRITEQGVQPDIGLGIGGA